MVLFVDDCWSSFMTWLNDANITGEFEEAGYAAGVVADGE